MSQMHEKAVMDENGWVKIPPAIRMRAGWLKKTDIIFASCSDRIIIARPIPGEVDDTIKKTQAALKLEESFSAMRAKNFGVSDEEIAEEIKEYRKEKRKAA